MEDDRAQREALRRVMRTAGVLTVAVATLADAMDLIESTPPAYAIVDLNLPDGLGTALLMQLRAAGSNTRVAVTTGTTDPELLADVEWLSPDLFISKPVDPDWLLPWVTACA